MLNQERFLILRIPGRHDVNGGGTFPPYWYDRHYLTMSALRTAGVLPLCDYKSPATGWPSVKGCKPSSQSSQSQSSSWQGYNKQGNCWDGTLSHCLCHSTGFRLKRWKKKKSLVFLICVSWSLVRQVFFFLPGLQIISIPFSVGDSLFTSFDHF